MHIVNRLFSNETRTNGERITNKESSFQFLDRCAWPLCGLMREYLNENLGDFYMDNEFMSRLRSQDNQQHDSAAFEFLVYRMLLSEGFSVTKHPDLASGRRPDFLISKLDTTDLILECTLSGNSYEPLEIKKRKEKVVDIIDEMHYFPYFINIDFDQVSDKSISAKALKNYIISLQNHVQNIEGIASLNHEFRFENNGWILSISLIKKPNLDIKYSTGMIGNGAKMIDSIKPLHSALNDKKASRYGNLNLPYIVCLSNTDGFFKEEEMTELLFGHYFGDKIPLLNNKGGYFLKNDKAINTSVSAILLFKNFDIYTLGHSRVSLWINPFAKIEVPKNLFSFPTYTFKKEGDYLIKPDLREMDYDVFEALSIDRATYLEGKEKSSDRSFPNITP